MPRSPDKSRSTRSGTLRIGDQWNAINIIARSQTHPLKAVCELVENAIDAKAENVEIIRRRIGGKVYLEVADDGAGVATSADGEPDFARIATHVCDSMKRHLSGPERNGVHGEFGIGLLSFWSLGETLRMISGSGPRGPFEMELRTGKKNYLVRPVRGRFALGGTRVVIGPLWDAARKVVTGDKLVRYLSGELRDRIRASGVVVQVTDRLLHKQLVVRPQEFLGERIACPERVATDFGPLRVELYLRGKVDGPAAGVAVCKDGTRVLRNIAELDAFEHAPWSDGQLEGVIDFPALALAPGTRSGIVPDERFSALVAAVQQIEPAVRDAVEAREHARTEKASEQILRQLQKAFVSALRELPASEYLFFDLPSPHDAATVGGRQKPGSESPSGVPVAAPPPAPTEEPAAGEPTQPELFPAEPGPLAAVRIRPRHPRARPGEDCLLHAVPLDEHGQPAAGPVAYEWQVIEGRGQLRADADACAVSCGEEGRVVVEVTATQGTVVVAAEAAVKFVATADAARDDSPQGLPTYRISAEHGQPWRSRYDGGANEIVINSAHRDFAASRTTLAKHRRYIGKLYAKEVVLINFPHESPSEVMERLIELTLRTEESL